MKSTCFSKYAWLVFLVLALAPRATLAQSAIAGLVTDATGAVLPGVTVEAASPVLIEKVRTVATDGQGRYNIVDLRPGAYVVTFALAGFSTVNRDGIDLPPNFTASVNVELKVGSINETVTVSSAGPIVDVQQAQRVQVLSRDMLNSIPTSRTTFGIGQLIPGIKLNNPDTGGQGMMQNVDTSVHGLQGGSNVVQIDGMTVNAMQLDGSAQPYLNQAMIDQFSYQTSATGADVSAGGARLNMISKQGGNRFLGDAYAGGTPASWIANNITPELIRRGLTSPSSIDHIYDFSAAEGGPINRDRLWFFAALRRSSVNNKIAGAFLPNGEPAIEDQFIASPAARLTWQVTPKNKLTAMYDRALKDKGHEYSFTNKKGISPEAVGRRPWREGNYYAEQAKWTSTLTNRAFLEVGFSRISEVHNIGYQPGVAQPRDSAAWYTGAARVDDVLLTLTGSPNSPLNDEYNIRNVAATAFSYVTGSHNVKVGMQYAFGPECYNRDANGDLQEHFLNRVASSVVVYNTPTRDCEVMNADRGLFAQDSWTFKRLTINPGVRFEHFNSKIEGAQVGAGRFVPARNFPEVADVPNWNDIAPRLGIAYDLLGDGKTALKAGINKYMQNWTTGFASRYSPGFLSTDQRNWTDANRDGVAQDDEIGPSNNNTFGLGTPSRFMAPNISRAYNMEYMAAVQREVLPGVSVTGAWYRRRFSNMEAVDNTPVTMADYTAFQLANPMGNGEMITIYNLNSSKQGQVHLVDRNSSVNTGIFNGFELSFTARLPHGGSAFGGWTPERVQWSQCDHGITLPIVTVGTNNNPVDNPNNLRFCDQTGATNQELGHNATIPYRHDFKFAGQYLLPLALRVSASLVSFAGAPLKVDWVVPASLFPGGRRTQVVTVPLISPGVQYFDRWSELDLGVTRDFTVGRVRMSPQIFVFNALNQGTVLTQNQVFGPALGTPSATLLGRMLRLSVMFRY